jgi:hypothetical protein
VVAEVAYPSRMVLRHGEILGHIAVY